MHILHKIKPFECTKANNLRRAQNPTSLAGRFPANLLQRHQQTPPLTFETRVCLCLVTCWAIQSRIADFLNFIYVHNIQQTVSITNFSLCEMTTS